MEHFILKSILINEDAFAAVFEGEKLVCVVAIAVQVCCRFAAVLAAVIAVLSLGRWVLEGMNQWAADCCAVTGLLGDSCSYRDFRVF
ncbi:hypothetical protein U1Q18_045194 [Sarracenia purpurea var. burkii]